MWKMKVSHNTGSPPTPCKISQPVVGVVQKHYIRDKAEYLSYPKRAKSRPVYLSLNFNCYWSVVFFGKHILGELEKFTDLQREITQR